MNATSRAVHVLLVEAGGWLVGLDASEVVMVDSAARDTGGTELFDLLGGRCADSPPSRRRRLSVGGDDAAGVVLVDQTLGTRSVEPRELQRLPATLRVLGAPDWWLGTMWLGERLVLLIDIARALGLGRSSSAA